MLFNPKEAVWSWVVKEVLSEASQSEMRPGRQEAASHSAGGEQRRPREKRTRAPRGSVARLIHRGKAEVTEARVGGTAHTQMRLEPGARGQGPGSAQSGRPRAARCA